MKKIIAGIDEAGRGCVLGRLHMAIACFDESSVEKYLQSEGVTDSKKIKQKKREELFHKINKCCYTDSMSISEEDIDNHNINDLEANGIVRLIKNTVEIYTSASLSEVSFKVIVDCPVKETEKYADQIRTLLDHPKAEIEIVCENKADENHIIVGAASIIAKVFREWEVDLFKNKYSYLSSDIGSGYPSDVRTIEFLTKYFEENKKFPIETRKKWGTVENIRRKVNGKSEPKGEGI